MEINHEEILNDYYDWLLSHLTFFEEFSKLLETLHKIKFRWRSSSDESRAKDGQNLRWDYVIENNLTNYEYDVLNKELGKASILEVMLALAIKMEQQMTDDRYGNRTSYWFHTMVASLGLNGIIDERFNEARVKDIIGRFLRKEYLPDGRGGLFKIKNFKGDLREESIWTQMCWYLDTIS